MLFFAEAVAVFTHGWSSGRLMRVLSEDQLSYIFVFPHQLIFALAFGGAIAAETENRLFRTISLAFWGVSFAAMLTNALLPLLHRYGDFEAVIAAVMVLLFLSGGVYLIMRRCHFSGLVVCGLGLFVWLVPIFVLILSSPSII